MYTDLQLYIDGAWHSGDGRKAEDVLNPASGKALASLPHASTADLDAALAAACPDGIDVYFDNTAGRISDAVYRRLNLGARAVVCGTASISSWEPWPDGPRIERHLLVKRARIQGFLLFDYAKRYDEGRARLAEWLKQGRLHYREDILDGLEQAPGAIARLYAGRNTGKLLIRVAPA